MNKISIAIGVAALLITGCSDKPQEQKSSAPTTTQTKNDVAPQELYGVSSKASPEQTQADADTTNIKAGTKHVATVLETMDAANYTYAKVDEGGNIYWIAGPQAKITVGSKISFLDQMVMENFTSKSLGRTFESILFVSTLIPTNKAEHDCDSCGPDGKPKIVAAPKPAQHGQKPQVLQIENVKVTKVSGGYSVEELYAKKAELKDKKIKLNAKVVKVSKNIMKKDWVHLQDGTGEGATSDIVVTTTNTTVKVGDVVTTEALLKTDVDFGYGYFYALILEEAKFTPVK